ncbi:BQ2448_5330 [Microbotryum intermedium]|uniref:BQ2448_5330 protein n=1 Tax=Microbotryum intermedium TaxID=269621 RepID=A0A238F4S2_9BASI|nr:BQ2448_5330 [Microbotryum intermedium]
MSFPSSASKTHSRPIASSSSSSTNPNPTTGSSLLARQKPSTSQTHPNSSNTAFRLSNDQLSEIREAFELFDHDRDQQLDYHEFKVCLRALGFDLKKAEVVRLLKEANGISGHAGVNVGEMRMGYDSFTAIGKQTTATLHRRAKIQLPRLITDCSSPPLVEGMIQRRDPMVELKRAFRLFDQDGTGKISLENLRKVASDLGEQLGDEELRAMIEEFDLDQDGMINEAEFMRLVFCSSKMPLGC